MTGPVALPMADTKLGPGTLTIGDVGTEIDIACLINGAKIVASKDQADSTVKLCGSTRPGAVTYTYELSGNVDVDIATSSGLFALSNSAAGTQLPFTFVPSTAAATSASGTLTIDPLDFGADENGADLVSDFAWALAGAPTYTFGDAGP